MEEPGAGGHPLRVAVADQATAAVGVGVAERPVEHVGDGLEAAVGVPRRALRLARGVLDLAHLVEVDERVEVGEVDALEGAPHREALALEAARGRGDRTHGARTGEGRLRSRDAGQRQEVVDGHCGHGGLLGRPPAYLT